MINYIFFFFIAAIPLHAMEYCLMSKDPLSKESKQQLDVLYSKAYYEKDNREKEAIISNIKVTHADLNASYETVVCYNRNPLKFTTPLEFALKHSIPFAHFLLEEIKILKQDIHLQKNLFSCCISRIKKHGFLPEYEDILEEILQRKADINQQDSVDTTPLGRYVMDVSSTYDPQVIRFFLHHKAKLTIANSYSEEECSKTIKTTHCDHECARKILSRRTNLIGLSFDDLYEVRKGKKEPLVTSLIAHLLNERLYQVKKDCFNLRLVCNYMNKEHAFKKVPRLLIESIIDTALFRSSDAYEDIYRALTWKDCGAYCSGYSIKLKTVAEKIEIFEWLSKYQDLHVIVSLPFWQQSFKNIVIALRLLIEKHTVLKQKN